jgi:ribosome biogenesis ATPase
MARNLRLSGDFDFSLLAKLSPGYVGADLKALTSEAGMIAVKRIFNSSLAISPESPMAIDDLHISKDVKHLDTNLIVADPKASQSSKLNVISDFLSSQNGALDQSQLDPLFVTNDDFLQALKIVQPSSKREGFATVPDVTWDDIGALNSVRQELRMAVVEPIKYPEMFASVGITTSSGVLLYGPPGCGKTLLAKAVSNESTCNFISVKGIPKFRITYKALNY